MYKDTGQIQYHENNVDNLKEDNSVLLIANNNINSVITLQPKESNGMSVKNSQE